MMIVRIDHNIGDHVSFTFNDEIVEGRIIEIVIKEKTMEYIVYLSTESYKKVKYNVVSVNANKIIK